MKLTRLAVALLLALPFVTMGVGQPQPDARPVVEELQAEAEALRPLMKSELAKAFLARTAELPEPTARGIHRNKERTRAVTDKQFAQLGEREREGFTRREFSPRFYYHTGYGTPLIFARVLELLSENDAANWTPEKMTSKRIVDFGCGTLGHLRLLASLGADTTGIDVEPIFQALYSEPGDQGEVEAQNGAKGRTRLLTGHWPGADAVRTTAGEGYDAFISKNTLKRGYIHPARETDPSRLVHLGVTDEEFVKAVYSVLKPGGVFMIYNIAPAQAPADQPYLPHADGQCPFDREVLEKAGFEVVKYDEEDQEAIIDYWRVLGLNHGKTEEEMKGELFAWWTLCRKPVERGAARINGEIRVTRNYAAEDNALIEQIPPDQLAWPVYREAVMKRVNQPDELVAAGWPAFPDEPHWADALGHLKENDAEIKLVQRAAQRPFLGAPASDQPDPVLESFYAETRGETYIPEPPSQNPMLSKVLMHHLGYMRGFTRLLVMDCRRACEEDDSKGFIENLRTLFGISRHAAQTRSVIAARVSVAITNQLAMTTGEMLATAPGLLSADEIGEVENLLERIECVPVVKKGIADERDYFMDFLQRAYTDDGEGSGVMTSEGWELLAEISGSEKDESPWFVKAGIADRASMLTKYDEITNAIIEEAERPMCSWQEFPDEVMNRVLDTTAKKARFCLVGIISPSIGKAVRAAYETEQSRDAVLVALALERYRRANGVYPGRLDELVPDFLAAVPLDRMDGKPMKYRLIDGKPVLYSVGMDRDDDGGRFNPNDPFGQHTWRSPAEVTAPNPGTKSVADADAPLWPIPRENRSRP